jgi:hypothetical protein
MQRTEVADKVNYSRVTLRNRRTWNKRKSRITLEGMMPDDGLVQPKHVVTVLIFQY